MKTSFVILAAALLSAKQTIAAPLTSDISSLESSKSEDFSKPLIEYEEGFESPHVYGTYKIPEASFRAPQKEEAEEESGVVYGLLVDTPPQLEDDDDDDDENLTYWYQTASSYATYEEENSDIEEPEELGAETSPADNAGEM